MPRGLARLNSVRRYNNIHIRQAEHGEEISSAWCVAPSAPRRRRVRAAQHVEVGVADGNANLIEVACRENVRKNRARQFAFACARPRQPPWLTAPQCPSRSTPRGAQACGIEIRIVMEPEMSRRMQRCVVVAHRQRGQSLARGLHRNVHGVALRCIAAHSTRSRTSSAVKHAFREHARLSLPVLRLGVNRQQESASATPSSASGRRQFFAIRRLACQPADFP